jgi:hypothetical protein
MHTFLTSPLCATHPFHIIILGVITLIMFGKEQNYEAHHYAVLSFLMVLFLCQAQIFYSASFETPSSLFSSGKRGSHTATQNSKTSFVW